MALPVAPDIEPVFHAGGRGAGRRLLADGRHQPFQLRSVQAAAQVQSTGKEPRPRRYCTQALRLRFQRGFRITPIHPMANLPFALAQ